MYDAHINFITKCQEGKLPTVYIIISTDMGDLVYAKKEMDIFDVAIALADGSHIADGGIIAGGTLTLATGEGRLLSISPITTTTQDMRYGSLEGSTIKRQGAITVTLDNTDRADNSQYYFSKIIAFNPFITKTIEGWTGFIGDSLSQHFQLFKLKIKAEELTPTKYYLICSEQ